MPTRLSFILGIILLTLSYTKSIPTSGATWNSGYNDNAKSAYSQQFNQDSKLRQRQYQNRTENYDEGRTHHHGTRGAFMNDIVGSEIEMLQDFENRPSYGFHYRRHYHPHESYEAEMQDSRYANEHRRQSFQRYFDEHVDVPHQFYRNHYRPTGGNSHHLSEAKEVAYGRDIWEGSDRYHHEHDQGKPTIMTQQHQAVEPYRQIHVEVEKQKVAGHTSIGTNPSAATLQDSLPTKLLEQKVAAGKLRPDLPHDKPVVFQQHTPDEGSLRNDGTLSPFHVHNENAPLLSARNQPREQRDFSQHQPSGESHEHQFTHPLVPEVRQIPPRQVRFFAGLSKTYTAPTSVEVEHTKPIEIEDYRNIHIAGHPVASKPKVIILTDEKLKTGQATVNMKLSLNENGMLQIELDEVPKFSLQERAAHAVDNNHEHQNYHFKEIMHRINRRPKSDEYARHQLEEVDYCRPWHDHFRHGHFERSHYRHDQSYRDCIRRHQLTPAAHISNSAPSSEHTDERQPPHYNLHKMGSLNRISLLKQTIDRQIDEAINMAETADDERMALVDKVPRNEKMRYERKGQSEQETAATSEKDADVKPVKASAKSESESSDIQTVDIDDPHANGCPSLKCSNNCPSGIWKLDIHTGCPSCSCCPDINCQLMCTNGYMADVHGCPLCKCLSV